MIETYTYTPRTYQTVFVTLKTPLKLPVQNRPLKAVCSITCSPDSPNILVTNQRGIRAAKKARLFGYDFCMVTYSAYNAVRKHFEESYRAPLGFRARYPTHRFCVSGRDVFTRFFPLPSDAKHVSLRIEEVRRFDLNYIS